MCRYTEALNMLFFSLITCCIKRKILGPFLLFIKWFDLRFTMHTEVDKSPVSWLYVLAHLNVFM